MAPPDKKRKRNPWDSSKDKAVHPKAPVGSGGQGGFSPKVPLNPSRNAKRPLPDPQSPAGRNAAPIDPPRDTSVPPPPALDMRAQMLAKALELNGKPIISDPRNGDRAECYDMVDKMLQDIGGQSVPELMKKWGPDTDYVWGTKIKIEDVQPGDILQIRDSQVNKVVSTKYKAVRSGETTPNGQTVTTEMFRGHHTSVVIAKNPDGSLQVMEQHVLNRERAMLSRTIMENTLPIKTLRGEPVKRTTTKDSIKVEETVQTDWVVVSGTLWAYRPIEKKTK
jgi:hypothetical protein